MALQTDADTYTEPRCCRGWLSHSGKKNNYIIDIECPFESRRSRSPTNCTFTSYLFIFGTVINKYKNVTLFLRLPCQGYKLYDATRLSGKWWFKYSAALPFIASLIWYFLNTPIKLVILQVVKLQELVQKIHLNFNLQSQFYYSVIIYWHTPSSLPPRTSRRRRTDCHTSDNNKPCIKL